MCVERLLRSLRLCRVPSLLVIVALSSSALRPELAGAQDSAAGAPVLSGRITDEDGLPVPMRGFKSFMLKAVSELRKCSPRARESTQSSE